MSPNHDQRLAVAEAAERLGLLHKPYEEGGYGDTYDCSGLAKKVWQGMVDLPHNTVQMKELLDDDEHHYGYYEPVSPQSTARLRPGDLVFYYDFDQPSHVAVFVARRFNLYVVAQATDTAHGSEVIKMHKYAEPVAYGFVRHS